MIKGKVTFFNNERGWGKIIGEDQREYFVHWKEIFPEEGFKVLYEGDEVEFETDDTPKGPIAINVKKI